MKREPIQPSALVCSLHGPCPFSLNRGTVPLILTWGGNPSRLWSFPFFSLTSLFSDFTVHVCVCVSLPKLERCNVDSLDGFSTLVNREFVMLSSTLTSIHHGSHRSLDDHLPSPIQLHHQYATDIPGSQHTRPRHIHLCSRSPLQARFELFPQRL